MTEEAREQKSNAIISDALYNLGKALVFLDCIIAEIETGNSSKEGDIPYPELALRPISELIKSIPPELTEYAEKIRSQANRLKSLVL